MSSRQPADDEHEFSLNQPRPVGRGLRPSGDNGRLDAHRLSLSKNAQKASHAKATRDSMRGLNEQQQRPQHPNTSESIRQSAVHSRPPPLVPSTPGTGAGTAGSPYMTNAGAGLGPHMLSNGPGYVQRPQPLDTTSGLLQHDPRLSTPFSASSQAHPLPNANTFAPFVPQTPVASRPPSHFSGHSHSTMANQLWPVNHSDTFVPQTASPSPLSADFQQANPDMLGGFPESHNGRLAQGGDPEDLYHEDPWNASSREQNPDPNDSTEDQHNELAGDEVQLPANAGLQIVSRTINTSQAPKRRRRKVAEKRHGGPSASTITDENLAPSEVSDDTDGDSPSIKKPRTRSIKQHSASVQNILKASYPRFKRMLSITNPFPKTPEECSLDAGEVIESAEMATAAWDEACEYLGVDIEPNLDLLKPIQDRLAQFRGQLRDRVREQILSNYGLVEPSFIPNPTPERMAEAKLKNREMMLSIKKTFYYLNPLDTSIPDSMYRNSIIQTVLIAHWFAKGRKSHESHFKNMNRLPLVTIALIVTAVSCVLDEWLTGAEVKVKFSYSAYSSVFQKRLDLLKQWETFSATQVPNLTHKLQEDLLRNARATRPDDATNNENEKNTEKEDVFAMFAANQG
ncbi:hypothetical protein HGRIS_008483 [Hohenbuehelia grisea]|uniref:DUF6532 domain-containing protein n=1 Tax=Hohenbuehelia grisea TaxID=104357 RepID=A0ABR3J8E4_9AGAR